MHQRLDESRLPCSCFFQYSCPKQVTRRESKSRSGAARALVASSLILAFSLGTVFSAQPAFAQDSTETPAQGTPSSVEPAAAPEASAATDNPPSPTRTVDRPGPPSQDAPLDFCANRPDPNSKVYQRKRVVVLNAYVGASSDAPEVEVNKDGVTIGNYEVFHAVHAGELFRPAMLNYLPLPRLFVAFSRKPAGAELLAKDKISLSEAQSAAGDDDFLSYSLVCSDYLVVPSVERGDATWRKVEKEKTVVVNGTSKTVKYLAWSVSAGWVTKARVFLHEGDGFRLVNTLDSDRGIFGGAAVGMSAGGKEDQPLHRYLSTWPTEECSVGSPRDGQAGTVSQCHAVEPVLTVGVTPEALAGPSCENDGAVNEGPSAMAAVARCAITSAASHAGKAIAFQVKDYWKIFAPLGVRGAERVIPVGVPEGLHRGDYYVATSKPGGYARVTRVGQGGNTSPSTIKFKAGDAPVGTPMIEKPLLGVQFGLRPGMMFLFSRGDLQSHYAIGGEGTVGLDLTRFLSWSDEVWARVNVGYFRGSHEEGLIDIDAGFEGIGYFGGGVSSILGLGYSALIPSLTRFDPVTRKDVAYSGVSSGVLARLGLEFAFSPDWNMTITGEGRYGFNKADLKNEKESTAVYDGGHLATVGGFLYLGHTL